MRTINRETSALLVVDFQARLMPAIEDGATAIANARRLLDAAALLDVPALGTLTAELGAEGGRDAGNCTQVPCVSDTSPAAAGWISTSALRF